MAKGMASKSRQAAQKISTQQKAKDAVRGGPKSQKKQPRPDAGRGQKG